MHRLIFMRTKKFQEWMGLKSELDLRIQKIPHVNEGEVWWTSVGENIGYEINGKSTLFTRPVLILKKFSREFYLVIPLTTQMRTGTWYVNFKLDQKEQIACLHQMRAIDYRRLSTKIGQVKKEDYQIIKKSLKDLI